LRVLRTALRMPAGERGTQPRVGAARCWGCGWLGFMAGVRSSRKLEAACRDQIPYDGAAQCNPKLL
jgi:hypothetical protein